MPPRNKPSRAAPLQELRARIEALEERVMRLEQGKAPPGDGRASVRPPGKGAQRCPGCGLELRRRRGRCVECGFPVEGTREAPALKR